MNFELFIAKKIHFGKKDENGGKLSKPAVRIAIGGVATGLTVIILAVAIVVGFKSEVRNKLIGFGSHFQITTNMDRNTMEITPMTYDANLINELSKVEGVRHVQQFANQPGVIKTNDNFQGIVLKGIGPDFDWSFFKDNIKKGRIAKITNDSTSKDVVISQKIADMLKLDVGDKMPTYFIINGKVRVRPLVVCGIYSTGFSDYDQIIIVGDIKNINRLNQWEDNQCGGLEVLINDYDQLDAAQENLFSVVGNRLDKGSNETFTMRSIKDINPQIFSWLDMLDVNVWIIMILMVLVAGFTIISGLLILILEKTQMIGILKALGAVNWSIRKIFLYQAVFLVGKGMLIGNAIGLALCFIQDKLHLFKLNPDVYYVDSVPIALSPLNWLLINIGVLVVSVLMLIGPSYIITKISPAQTIRFE